MIRVMMSSMRSSKTLAELATDYEIHPQSLLYRVCDWVGKHTRTIILTPHMAAVGNCAEEVYFGLLKARREGKKLVILWPYELPWRLKFRLTNIEVVNIDSDYRAVPHNGFLNIVGRILLTAYFAFFRTLSLLRRLLLGVHLNNVYRIPIIGASTLWQPDEFAHEFSWSVVNQYDWGKQLATPVHVSLERKKRLIAERHRVQIGLPEDAWFVCLHVRESGFHKDQYVERNANILNYLDAIEEITSRGGWVVRMGDATMTKLPAMNRVIDYPFTEVKSALMDVYLISQCSLYIGMISGIYDVARLFQRPMIMTNMTNWLVAYPQLRSDLGVMKHIFSKSKNRFLTVREWLAEPWDAVAHSHKLGDDYVFYENTPDELRAVVAEFFDRGDNWEPTSLQRQFNDLRAHRGRELLSETIYSADDVQLYYRRNVVAYDVMNRYRIASRLDSAVGMLGSEFLRQNWESSVGAAKPAELYG
jgi:putative glycosyltransferase (TIGR04372 family)